LKSKLKNYIRLPIAFWHRKNRTTEQRALPEKAHGAVDHDYLHYGDLALDIATATNLKQALPNLLSPLQQQLNICFTAETQCHLHLVLTSSKNTATPDIIHSKNVIPSSIIVNQFRFHLGDKAAENITQQVALTGCTNKIYSQLLTDEDTFSRAWLVLVFNDKMPLHTAIHHYLSPIARMLSRGLCASFEREQKIQQAIAAERSAQAAELHDSMAQILGYLHLKTSQMASLCKEKNDPELQDLSACIAYQTHYAYRITRELISTSRLSMQDKNLSQIIRETITEFEQQSNVVFELDNRTLQGDNVGEQETQLQLIVREALCNIVRHSHATHARVQMNSDENHLTIKIEDNGHGIKQESKHHNSFGLTIMQERAERIGAEFHIGKRQPHGTVIEITHRYSK
jgi:nitrate/nitrite-specific signal transduction histidine kinase